RRTPDIASAWPAPDLDATGDHRAGRGGCRCRPLFAASFCPAVRRVPAGVPVGARCRRTEPRHARRLRIGRPDSGVAGVSVWRGPAVFRRNARNRYAPGKPRLFDPSSLD
nr:hypothetical protein [Tanacetum cinerariifolium]